MPKIFQLCMHHLTEGLTEVEVVADDFVVYGYRENNSEVIQDHNKKLQEFLQM